MANKFLGALGLDVLVGKIKDVIAKLDTKQDNIQAVICEAIAEPFNLAQLIGISFDDVAKMPYIVIVKHVCLNGRKLEYDSGPNAAIFIFGSMGYHMIMDGDLYYCNGIMSPLSNDNFWDVNFEPSVKIRYNGGLVQVYNGNTWVNYEGTGVTVEEITAQEVTNKFNA